MPPARMHGYSPYAVSVLTKTLPFVFARTRPLPRPERRHENNSETYVPLQWSDALAAESLVFAQHLIDNNQLYHDPDRGPYGENLAYNWGSGGQPATDYVLGRECASFRLRGVVVRSPRRRTFSLPFARPLSNRTGWVEEEAGAAYPANGHLTQVLWRATTWAGCADASSGYTHIQVCRYARPGEFGPMGTRAAEPPKTTPTKDDHPTPSTSSPFPPLQTGNCNMANYGTWLEPMLLPTSPCGAECHPSECGLGGADETPVAPQTNPAPAPVPAPAPAPTQATAAAPVPQGVRVAQWLDSHNTRRKSW